MNGIHNPNTAALTLAACLLLTFMQAPPATAQTSSPPDATMRASRHDRLATKALLLDVASAGSRVVAVGEHGIIIHSDDGGVNWSQAAPPTREVLTGISFTDITHGWAVGHGGVVLRSRNAGTSWEAVSAPVEAEDSFLDVLALTREHIFAVGAYGLFLETRDAGASWIEREPIEEDMHINRISPGPSGTLLLAGEAGMLARSTDLGETWEQLHTAYDGSFYGLLELESGRLLAHGLRGHVLTSDDGGENWIQTVMDREVLLMTAREIEPGMVLVGGLGGMTFLSRDGGSTFSTFPLENLKACAELLPLPGGGILAFGEGGVARISVITGASRPD